MELCNYSFKYKYLLWISKCEYQLLNSLDFDNLFHSVAVRIILKFLKLLVNVNRIRNFSQILLREINFVINFQNHCLSQCQPHS